MPQADYERIGKLIYGSFRYGANMTDIVNWIADELGIAAPDARDEHATVMLLNAFAARFSSEEEFQEKCERFFDQLKSAGA